MFDVLDRDGRVSGQGPYMHSDLPFVFLCMCSLGDRAERTRVAGRRFRARGAELCGADQVVSLRPRTPRHFWRASPPPPPRRSPPDRACRAPTPGGWTLQHLDRTRAQRLRVPATRAHACPLPPAPRLRPLVPAPRVFLCRERRLRQRHTSTSRAQSVCGGIVCAFFSFNS